LLGCLPWTRVVQFTGNLYFRLLDLDRDRCQPDLDLSPEPAGGEDRKRVEFNPPDTQFPS